MIRTELVAVAMSVFVLMVAVSGGVTFAVLSDSHTVSVELPAGGGNASVNATATPTPAAGVDTASTDCGIGGTQHSDSGNGQDISIVLEPSDDRSIAVGERVEYDIYVRGATDNVGGYNLNFTLCDPQIATFENFTHTKNSRYHDTSLSLDEVVASGGNGTADGIVGPVVYLGTLTVAGNSTGQTGLGVTDVDDGHVRVINPAGPAYNITSTDTTVLTVEEAENSPQSDS